MMLERPAILGIVFGAAIGGVNIALQILEEKDLRKEAERLKAIEEQHDETGT